MQRGFLNKPPKKKRNPSKDAETCGPVETSVDQKNNKSQQHDDLFVDETSATSKSSSHGQNDQNTVNISTSSDIEQKKHVTFSPATNVPNQKKVGGSSYSSTTTKMSSPTTTPVPLPTVTPSPTANHPYVEIREMLDSNGNEIKSETIDLTKELKCLQNEIKQKTKEKQRQQKKDDDDDDDDDEHEEGESKEEDLEEIKNNSGATKKSVQWQPDEKEEVEEDEDAISFSLGQPSQERYNEITSRLDQLALEEERYEKERAINEASSQILQGTGWKKGFFDSKKKSTSTNKKKQQKQQQQQQKPTMKKAVPTQNQQTTRTQQSTQQTSAKKEVNPVATEEKKEEIIEKQSTEKKQVMPAREKATEQTERPASSATVVTARGGSSGILKQPKYSAVPTTSSTSALALTPNDEHANNASDQHNKSQPSMAASSIFDGAVLERKELPVRSIEPTKVATLPKAVEQTQTQAHAPPSTENIQSVQPTKKLSRFAQQRLEQQQRRR